MDTSASRSRGSEPLARRVRGLSGTAYEDLDAWPRPDEGGLGEKTTCYQKRKAAVRHYLQGTADAELRRCFSLSSKGIYRLIIKRCLAVHPDGQIYGWRGLIPYLRIEHYTRKKKVTVDAAGRGAVGAMRMVLDLEPTLRTAFDKRILAGHHDGKLEEKHSCRSHWKWFVEKLREKGYAIRNEWPFNTESVGYLSVCRYVKAVLAARPEKGAAVVGGKDAQRKLKSGDGVDRPVGQLFQRVEMDAHKLDGRFCILIPRGDGSYAEKIVHRLWVIVLLEVMTRAVVGYYFSYRYEISKDDVLRAIKMALTPWERRSISFGNLAYRDGAALPSGHSPAYVGVCWEETSVDGALAERCEHVRVVLKNVMGSELIEPSSGFSARRSKDDRPFIESFFRHLGSGGFHRLSNTTGGKPKDKGGNNPDRVAVVSRFQVDYAEEMVEVLIANYNATPHSGLGGRTPLEYLDFLASRPGRNNLRYADPEEVQRMLSYRKLCAVRGNLAEGRRPYVNFANATYHGDTLSQRFDLIGKRIWVENHIERDARVALAYTPSGDALGALRAAPPWHKTPHSIEVRAAIVSCLRRKLFRLSADGDAVQNFHEFYEASGGKLPPHPMFLESRRILAQYGQQHLGDVVLASAMEKLETFSENERPSSPLQMSNDGATCKTSLPARRKARTA